MVREQDRPLIFERLDFRPLGGELCVTSTELARELGFRHPQRLDRWIGDHAKEMASFDVPRSVDMVVPTGPGTARWCRTYWLTEAHVFFIIMSCRAPYARAALEDVLSQWGRDKDDIGLSPFSLFGAAFSRAQENPRQN
ncbi:MAG: hypothetical protein EOO23_02550 [Comamonadaceae bacterium]|nr:MAG: hypothetical protein EOO23_02550 [Comamonadaceae bacterium]